MKLNSILNDKGRSVEMKEKDILNLAHCFQRHSDPTLVECFGFSLLYYTLREISCMLVTARLHHLIHIKLSVLKGLFVTKSNYIFPLFTVVLFIPIGWYEVQTLIMVSSLSTTPSG